MVEREILMTRPGSPRRLPAFDIALFASMVIALIGLGPMRAVAADDEPWMKQCKIIHGDSAPNNVYAYKFNRQGPAYSITNQREILGYYAEYRYTVLDMSDNTLTCYTNLNRDFLFFHQQTKYGDLYGTANRKYSMSPPDIK